MLKNTVVWISYYQPWSFDTTVRGRVIVVRVDKHSDAGPHDGRRSEFDGLTVAPIRRTNVFVDVLTVQAERDNRSSVPRSVDHTPPVPAIGFVSAPEKPTVTARAGSSSSCLWTLQYVDM